MCKKIILSIVLVFGYIFSSGQDNDIILNGYNKFYYENGNLSSEGNMKNGKPEGFWKTYYPSGIIKSEGNRKNYKLDSTWIFYDEKGNKKLELNYLKGNKNGKKINYNFYGFILREEYYANNVRDSITNIYFNDTLKQGGLYIVTNFKENEKHGKELEYMQEGLLIRITTYDKGYITKEDEINRLDIFGMKTGKWKEYYDNGKVKMEGKYKKDKKEGIFREYTVDGKLKNTDKYKNGIIVVDSEVSVEIKIEKDYYSDAKVKSELTLINGIPNGIYREYSQEGDILLAKMYSEGKVIGEGIIDKKGKKQGDWKEFYFDSKQVKMDGIYVEGKKEGEWKFYYQSGKIEQKGNYKNGKPEGVWKWYYESGNLLREEEFRNGKEEGYIKEYSDSVDVILNGSYIDGKKEGEWIYEVGDHREEGSYIDDKRQGEWIYYYDNEQQSFIGEYIDGSENGKHSYYYKNGKLKEEGIYSMGLKEGVWKKYNEDGSLFLSITFESGIERKYEGVKLKPSY